MDDKKKALIHALQTKLRALADQHMDILVPSKDCLVSTSTTPSVNNDFEATWKDLERLVDPLSTPETLPLAARRALHMKKPGQALQLVRKMIKEQGSNKTTSSASYRKELSQVLVAVLDRLGPDWVHLADSARIQAVINHPKDYALH